MVMHARKTQRINDGYFEKHQAHPYQALKAQPAAVSCSARRRRMQYGGACGQHTILPAINSKYGGSKGSYDSRYNHERARDSPNSNSYRSDSPDSQSPRDRSYPNKNMYVHKIREKERENRDYKSRDKYSECTRSPKEKRSRDSRDAEHRTNHDRSSNSMEKIIVHSAKSSTQNSSSRDYAREIPRDVIREAPRESSRDSSSRDAMRESSRDPGQRKPVQNSCQEKREPERERLLRFGDWSEHISSSGKKYYYNCKTEVSQWEKPKEWLDRDKAAERDRAREKQQLLDRSYSSGSNSGSSGSMSSCARPSHEKHSNFRPLPTNGRDNLMKHGPAMVSSSRPGEKREAYWNSQSSGSREEVENHDRKRLMDGEMQSQDMDISPGSSTPTSETSYPQITHTPHQGEVPLMLPGTLPSHPHQLQTTVPMRPPPYQQHVPGVKPMEQPDMVQQQSVLQSMQPGLISRQASVVDSQPVPVTQVSPQAMQPLKVDTGDGQIVVEGPPTPTHSESLDCVDARKLASPPSSLSSIQSLAQAQVGSSLHALRPQGPHLTPSLANHYRDDLVNHVRGWPADVLEKQAQKLAEENHIMGSLHCTKVSADLKVARSIVRLTEIQATLQEQRILFLRQQLESLQQLKSHNSFMSDDCS